MDSITTVEVEFEDGTKARWGLTADDPRLPALEQLLGAPDTLIA